MADPLAVTERLYSFAGVELTEELRAKVRSRNNRPRGGGRQLRDDLYGPLGFYRCNSRPPLTSVTEPTQFFFVIVTLPYITDKIKKKLFFYSTIRSKHFDPESWRSKLTREEVLQVEHECRKLMTRMGYRIAGRAH